MQIRACGIAWYHKEDYKKILEVMEDSHKLPGTFKQWLDSANNGIKRFSSEGRIVEKVYIDPETFPDWCRARSMNVDANARMRFANEFVGRKYANQS
jgi:hypothetical protein